MKVEQAFEFADASAERSANGCTVRLNKEPIIEYLQSNITLMQNLIEQGYEDKRTLQRRIEGMQNWLNNPELMEPDANAKYASIIEIDLNTITEPLIACQMIQITLKLYQRFLEIKLMRYLLEAV